MKFDEQNDIFNELKNAYRAFFTAFNKYTADFFEKRLYETKNENIKDLSSCLSRIANAIANLEKTVDLGNNLIIEDTNASLIDIAGIVSNINVRYNNLPEKDKLLVEIHTFFSICFKTLINDIIQKYNEIHEQKLYTIEEAFTVYIQREPEFLF